MKKSLKIILIIVVFLIALVGIGLFIIGPLVTRPTKNYKSLIWRF